MRYELNNIVQIEYSIDVEKPNENGDDVEVPKCYSSMVENFHLGSDGNYHWEFSKNEVRLAGSPDKGSCKPDDIKSVLLSNGNNRYRVYLVKGKKVIADFYKLQRESIILSSQDDYEFVDFERGLSEEVSNMVLNLKKDFSHYKQQNNNHGFTFIKDGLFFEFPSELGDIYNLKKAEFHIKQNNIGDNVAFNVYFNSKQGVKLSLDITYDDIIQGEDIHSSIDRLFKMVDIIYSHRDFIGI